jgi:hypothetical protein
MADKKQDYAPDLAKIMRDSDRKVLDAKLQKALDNPKGAAAIARIKSKLRPGEDPLFYDISKRLSSPSLTGVTPVDEDTTIPKGEAPAPAGEEPSESAPDSGSPWAQSDAADGDIDKAALPSAHVPPAAPPTSVPIPPKAVRARRRRELPMWGLSPRLIAALAVFAVLAPVTIVFVMSRTTTPAERKHGTAPSVAAGATAPPAPTGPATTARPAPTGPGATATSPVPAAAVEDGGGAAVPAPSSAPTPAPRAPSAPVKPGASGDPYSSPPSPPATVAPRPVKPGPPASPASPATAATSEPPPPPPKMIN